MVEAHCADALICISNCDKITPGMLIAALRLNIPTVFVSGGPMEAGRRHPGRRHGPQARPDRRDLAAAERRDLRRGHPAYRGERLPDLRLLFRHVHRQLDELPDRGHRPVRSPATARRSPRTPPARRCTRTPARTVVDITRRYYEQDDASVLPRNIATRGRVRERHGARHRHGRLDQHDPAPAGRGPGGGRRLRPGRDRRGLAPGALPGQGRAERRQDGTYYMEDVHRAGGIPAILGELHRGRPAQRGRALRAQPDPARTG